MSDERPRVSSSARSSARNSSPASAQAHATYRRSRLATSSEGHRRDQSPFAVRGFLHPQERRERRLARTWRVSPAFVGCNSPMLSIARCTWAEHVAALRATSVHSRLSLATAEIRVDGHGEDVLRERRLALAAHHRGELGRGEVWPRAVDASVGPLHVARGVSSRRGARASFNRTRPRTS